MLSDMTVEKEPTSPATPIGLSEAVSSEIAKMIERVGPSVVQVVREGRGGGAGVIWRSNGGVITNYHVIAATGGDVQVLLPDGRKFDARVTNQNPALDLAVLEVDAEDLPAALVDDSSKLRVGELVFAMGHPWGHRNVVTAGIVSGLGEVPVPHTGRNAQYIRSDVHVAPGNSGGPMLNAQGAVVGITAMIFGGDMAVAIPSRVASDWVAGLPSRRVYLGVGVRPVELPIEIRGRDRAAVAAGLLVTGIESDGPAARAGLLVGDVLLAAAGKPVVDGEALLDVLAQSATERNVQLHVMRRGAVQTVDVDLGEDSAPETSA
jgi:serine protease Do